jgi:hypothetical protein
MLTPEAAFRGFRAASAPPISYMAREVASDEPRASHGYLRAQATLDRPHFISWTKSPQQKR